MTPELIREYIEEANPNALFMDGLDDAIIGVIARGNEPVLVCYSYDLLIGEHIGQGMDYDEAREFVDFNIMNAWLGEGTPVILDMETKCR